jgi:hypothetical protein
MIMNNKQPRNHLEGVNRTVRTCQGSWCIISVSNPVPLELRSGAGVFNFSRGRDALANRHGLSVAILSIATLGKTSIAVHQWAAKQFRVDRQSFKQKDNIHCLEKVQITKLNVYLQFKLNYDVCYTYE